MNRRSKQDQCEAVDYYAGMSHQRSNEGKRIEPSPLEMTAAEDSNGMSADLRISIRDRRVFCIGNGGIVYRQGRPWTQRDIGGFLTEMGKFVEEICFCSWLDPVDDALSQTPLQDIRGVRALGLPAFRGSFPRKLINGTRSFAMVLREVSHADFVYLYWPGRLSSITARLCRAIRKPYGIYFRGEQIDPDPTFATAFRYARFILTTGDVLRNEAKAYCQDVENVTPMTPVRPKHVRRPRLPRQSGPWHLLYVGRIEERKGVLDLLDALSYLREWGVPFTLTMVGHCYDKLGLLRHLPPSIAQHVRLIDAVADFERLIPFYCGADAFVCPSHCGEGFPRVLYEAMAFGVPILTTFGASIPAVMLDRKNCLRIEVKNPRDIAEKIRDLVTNPELQSQIAESSRQCVLELMATWKRSHAVQIAERLRDIFARPLSA
jgi:glycosyltransferase involved in cell wall biosynthesis